MRMHSVSRVASTLPPDSTTHTLPWPGRTRPDSNAATAGGAGALDDELGALEQ